MKPNKPASELQEAVDSLKPYYRRAIWFSVLASFMALTGVVYMMETYDRVVTTRNERTLLMLTILVLAAYVVAEVIEWSRDQLTHVAGQLFDRQLVDRTFTAMFVAYQRRLPGGHPQTMSDLKSLRDFFSSGLVHTLMGAPAIIVYLVLVFMIHWILGWALVMVVLLHLVLTYMSQRSTNSKLISANRAAMQAQQFADNTLRNAQVIEAMGMQANIYQRWIQKQRESLNHQAEASDQAGTYMAVIKFLNLVVGSKLMLGLGTFLLMSGMLDDRGSKLIGASILAGKVFAPFGAIISQWRAIGQTREAWQRLTKLFEDVPRNAAPMPLPAPRGILQVEQLVAAAPGTQVPILRGIAFALQPGEVLAVVGPSASGKTSLARLLVGLWPAASGKVRLDGADVYTWDKEELGPHMGYLPQDVELFEGSFAENIARFGDVDMAKVEAAARHVGLHEFILERPQGYDGPVGGDGGRLSGGQRQRIGLARAIYGDPALVVLDEPNSSLDEEGDAALARTIASLKAKGTTFVVITHRTSVLGVTDKMLVLRDGQAHAFGPRDEVLAALSRAANPAVPAGDANPGARPQLAPAA